MRAKAAWLLGNAMASVYTAETEYRREFLPAPSRAKPFPDAEAVATAQKLERLAREIGAIEGAIHQQPVPENDRMTQRYRQEAPRFKSSSNRTSSSSVSASYYEPSSPDTTAPQSSAACPTLRSASKPSAPHSTIAKLSSTSV